MTSAMSSLGSKTQALFACGLALRPGGLLSSMAERAQYFVVCERARLGQCESESCACSTAKLCSLHRMHDAVQTPSASIWLSGFKKPVAFMYDAVQTPSASMR